MRVLVVGGGGREHALAWKLAQSPAVDKVFAAPGNPGIAEVAECFPDVGTDPATVAGLAERLGIELTVVGPEAPLVAGIADVLAERDLPAFGPSAAAARLEGSKSFAKEVMDRAHVPTARALVFHDEATALASLEMFAAPYVVKADGLAAGKGVTVAPTTDDAEAAIRDAFGGRFGEAGSSVLLEDHLRGEELSIFCVTDGEDVVPLAEAQDFKRAHDGDQGPNTGGMGAFSPVPHLPSDIVERSVDEIFRPVVRTMARLGSPYRGLLYGGLMITEDGPKVIEFNCRFGDPEAQAILPRYDGDLAELLVACTQGSLGTIRPAYRPEACVTVVLASGGYPGSYETGKPIDGLDEVAPMRDVVVFHAGTERDGDRIVTAGGRVVAVSALGADVAAARALAYDAASQVTFEGMQYRTDIAARAAGEGWNA